MIPTLEESVKDNSRKTTKPNGGVTHIDLPETTEASESFDIHSLEVDKATVATQETATPTASTTFPFLIVNKAQFNKITFSVGKRISLFFEHTFPFFTQSIFAPIFHIIYRCFFIIDIKGKEHLKNTKGPNLFISNHIAFYDSFMFDLFVPSFSHILPFRFMGAKVFLSPFLATLKFIGVVDLIYFLFGVFRVTRGEGAEKSLQKAYEIIKNGGTVAMFPEGKIWKPTAVHPEKIGPFKWGAAILAKNTGVRVIPISFKKVLRETKFRDKMEIRIGEPFFVDGDKTPEDIAAQMRNILINLYTDLD